MKLRLKSFDATLKVYDGILLDGKLSEYEEAFRAIDKTGNGTLGAVELARLFDSLGQPLSYQQLVEIFKKYDKDSSGQIELNEFLQMFRCVGPGSQLAVLCSVVGANFHPGLLLGTFALVAMHL